MKVADAASEAYMVVDWAKADSDNPSSETAGLGNRSWARGHAPVVVDRAALKLAEVDWMEEAHESHLAVRMAQSHDSYVVLYAAQGSARVHARSP